MEWIALPNTLFEKSMHISMIFEWRNQLYTQNVQPKIHLDVVIREGVKLHQ